VTEHVVSPTLARPSPLGDVDGSRENAMQIARRQSRVMTAAQSPRDANRTTESSTPDLHIIAHRAPRASSVSHSGDINTSPPLSCLRNASVIGSVT